MNTEYAPFSLFIPRIYFVKIAGTELHIFSDQKVAGQAEGVCQTSDLDISEVPGFQDAEGNVSTDTDLELRGTKRKSDSQTLCACMFLRYRCRISPEST